MCVGIPNASTAESPRRWASVSAQASALRLPTTTLAPPQTRPSAIARPMPRVPPVTIATRSRTSNSRASLTSSIGPSGEDGENALRADPLTQKCRIIQHNVRAVLTSATADVGPARSGMNRRLALLTGGYFVVIGIVLGAVLPFAVHVLRIETAIQHRLAPATTNARALLSTALDQETAERRYVVAPNATSLAAYEDARRAVADAERDLERLPLRADERAAFRDATDAFAGWEHDYSDREIGRIRSGATGLAEARAAAGNARGDALFDTFRRAQSRFVDLVERRLASQRNDLHRQSILAIVALVAASAIAVASAVLFRRWARSSIKRDDQQVRERIAFSEVHRLASMLAAARTTDEIAHVAARETSKLLGAADVHVWTIDGRDRLHLAGTTDTLAGTGRGPSVLALSDHNAPADAIRSDQLLFFEDRRAYDAAYPGWVSSFDMQGADALAVVPAHSDRQPVGVLEVFYFADVVFDDAQRTLLELTATQIGNAIGRARTREHENAAAETLQVSLLGPPMLVDGVGHSSRYLAAEGPLFVGGDWHNAQRLPDGRIMIAVGDVVGRGLEAATVMGQLRSAVSACALRCNTPADLLECLDDFAAVLPGAPSTTVALAYVDVEKQTLDYVSAGHPPPVLVSPEGHVCVLEGAMTWPLAVGRIPRTQTGATVPFPPGSLVLLYSDGLVERRSETLDTGIARLVESVRANWNTPMDALCDAVLGDLLHGHRRDDDVALLALRSPVAAPDLFLMKIAAAPDAVGRVRERLRAWLDSLSLDPDDQLAILVAVGEACTNAIEHAYSDGGANLFRVEAGVRDGSLVCCVTDTGAWKDNATRTARGNGLAIMRELMDEVLVDRRPNGTSVTLTYRPGVRNEPAVLG